MQGRLHHPPFPDPDPVHDGECTMPISVDARDRLVREHEEYRRLYEKHRSFEEKLEKLNSRLFLSDEEKVEAITLKKHKLALKDRMAEIAKEFAQDEADRAGH